MFSKVNKELLIFLFFLGLSGIFWLNMALNETYEKEFAIPVSVVGIPKNAVLTSDEVDTVRMTIRDKGFTLLTYMYGDVLKKISVVVMETHYGEEDRMVDAFRKEGFIVYSNQEAPFRTGTLFAVRQ